MMFEFFGNILESLGDNTSIRARLFRILSLIGGAVLIYFAVTYWISFANTDGNVFYWPGIISFIRILFGNIDWERQIIFYLACFLSAIGGFNVLIGLSRILYIVMYEWIEDADNALGRLFLVILFLPQIALLILAPILFYIGLLGIIVLFFIYGNCYQGDALVNGILVPWQASVQIAGGLAPIFITLMIAFINWIRTGEFKFLGE